ncbi:MAG TPA: hypothetical protein ENJ57_07035, partial [Rhizobiales bacterium]|nr:hypothetical protein [Hyphomicrobiales bacterium]
MSTGNIVISFLLALKIVISMSVVTGLSLIAERASPKLAGILAGYPHGVAIVLFFIGLEEGSVFAAKAAIYAIAGLAANVTLAVVYALSCRGFKTASPLAAPLLSLVAFFALAAVLNALKLNTGAALGIAIFFVLAAGFLLRRGEDVQIRTAGGLRFGALIFRAVLATLIVLAITGGA